MTTSSVASPDPGEDRGHDAVASRALEREAGGRRGPDTLEESLPQRRARARKSSLNDILAVAQARPSHTRAESFHLTQHEHLARAVGEFVDRALE